MTPQTAQTNEALDCTVDRILTALRNAPAPTGLNQRITARLSIAQAQQPSSLAARSWQLIAGRPNRAARSQQVLAEQSNRPSLAARSRQLAAGRLAPAHRYFLAALALVALAVIALHHKAQPITQSSTTPRPLYTPSTPTSPQETLSATPRPGDHQEPQGFSLMSREPPERAEGLTSASIETDPDALALAETLAPSRPIPHMPLTAEEHLFVLATRQGQPMELAELETLRQPALQARAEAREQATIRNYIHSLLAPLAAAEAINPTPPTEDASIPQPSSR